MVTLLGHCECINSTDIVVRNEFINQWVSPGFSRGMFPVLVNQTFNGYPKFDPRFIVYLN